MCAHRGRPAVAPGGRCPLSTDAQIASPRRFLFAATTPPQIPLPTPPSRSLGVAVAGFPPQVPTTPSAGPQSTREKLGPRGRAWGAESPFPAWRIPGRCCHQRTRPTPPPALFARPRAASRGLMLALVEEVPFSSGCRRALLDLRFPSQAMGPVGTYLHRDTLCQSARTGLPQGSPPSHPFLV